MTLTELIRDWRAERAARREESAAYAAWRRASHEYSDIAVIYRDQRGAWGNGPIGQAMRAVDDRHREYVALRAARERREETR